ncbi:MAG TPA: response regulator, partial [Candidatus Dormibacteraeota bacterium]|nr:response regulator [Candidatus Dormibacteraeota bacterium]
MPAQRANAPDSRLIRLPSSSFERLVESSPDIVVAVDRNGTVIYYNDGAEKGLGYTAAEILGENVGRLYPSMQEAHRVMVAMRSDDSGGPGKVKNFETTFITRSGEALPVAISGSILYDENGLEMGSIGFAKDIREIRQRDRLATLGEVAVALCHEINSPLEVILNDTELLSAFVRRKATDEEAVVEEERVDAVRREVLKIQEIVNRLVDMAREGQYGTRDYLVGQQMTDVSRPTATPGLRRSDGGLEGLRVLVVDDDLGVCRSLRDVLLAEGCEVLVASDGLRALEILNRTSVDIIISDVVMPDLDGYDLFMEVKRRGTTPVILMTGYYYDRDHVIKRSRLEGLESVIFKKPIDPARLKAMIRTLTG